VLIYDCSPFPFDLLACLACLPAEGLCKGLGCDKAFGLSRMQNNQSICNPKSERSSTDFADNNGQPAAATLTLQRCEEFGPQNTAKGRQQTGV